VDEYDARSDALRAEYHRKLLGLEDKRPPVVLDHDFRPSNGESNILHAVIRAEHRMRLDDARHARELDDLDVWFYSSLDQIAKECGLEDLRRDCRCRG
jgi:hypothetical protein